MLGKPLTGSREAWCLKHGIVLESTCRAGEMPRALHCSLHVCESLRWQWRE